jgi:putative acetyltransferase
LVIREERLSDRAAIRVLYRTIFGRENESQLVDRLRDDGLHVASLVAADGDEVIGHVLFSDLRIETQTGPMRGAALAPIGVLASRQRTGIGSELIRDGMQICREKGRSAVLVLGDPQYYSRLGFRADLAKRLKSPYSDAGKNWMAAELAPGALRDVFGLVRYPEAFQILESGM